MKKQLHLFEAEIICFPVDRRYAEVRRAAETMNRLRGKAAEKFWKDLLISLSAPLKASGIQSDEVRQQMLNFREEVCLEMWRLTEGDSRRPGSGQ